MTTLPAYVGRYEIRGEIDRGSFAQVALAWDEELESLVALKILHPTERATEARFMEEARLLRRVNAPNVVSVHDVGRLSDGRPYFVLDYADRGTLAKRLQSPFLPDTNPKTGDAAELSAYDKKLQSLLYLLDSIADGLAAIHAVGLIHRDIKPANILLQSMRGVQSTLPELDTQTASNPHTSKDPGSMPGGLLLGVDERVLVGDLGIAKDLTIQHEAPTMVGGTPRYLAPEQQDPSAQLSPSTDIYALTALLWKILTAREPPLGAQLQKQAAMLAPHWQEMILRGMQTEATQRHQSIDEWRVHAHEAIGADSSSHAFYGIGDSPTTDVCPYKGLAAYQPDDAKFFCGREALSDELLHRMQLHQVLVVGGPSGSGKSSLVRAGLIPALQSNALPGSNEWELVLFTPGADPLASLNAQLHHTSELQKLLQQASVAKKSTVTKLLAIDQFEEIFTLASEESRREFLSVLAKLTEAAYSQVKVVLVVRADFYGECAKEPWLAGRISNNQVLVGPMSAHELRRAVTEPARKAGYFLEHGLVDAITQEAGSEAGSLPLVAHALVETWVRRNGNTLTLEGFREAGGVAGAISQTADATYEHRFNDDDRRVSKSLLLSLVAPGAKTPDTRRVLSRSEMRSTGEQDSLLRVINELTEARLLTIDDDKVQIAHEALLHSWPRLHHWIEESRDELRVRQKITHAATEWTNENHDTDLLYRGTPLLTATEWQSRNPEQVGALEMQFLQASEQYRLDQQLRTSERERKAKRIKRGAVTLLTVLAISATMASVVAYIGFRDSKASQQRAEQATQIAQSRFASALGAAAFGHVESDPRLSLVLSAEAMAHSSTATHSFDTRAAMVSARQRLAQGGPFLLGSPLVAGDALSIALNPQGSLMAIGQADGGLDFIDTSSQKSLQDTVKDHSSGIRDLAFSADGRQLVSAGADGQLRLWSTDAQRRWHSTQVASLTDVVFDVDFVDDGASVFSTNDDGTIVQWSVDIANAWNKPLTRADVGFNTIAISADGRYLVAGNADKSITAWSLATGETVMGPLSNIHSSHLVDIHFNPAGSRVLTLSTDGESKLLSFPDGNIIDTLFEPELPAHAARFLPGSELVLAGHSNGRLGLWDTAADDTTLVRYSAIGHTQTIIETAVTDDGKLIATLGRDQVIRFWTLGDHYPVATFQQQIANAAKGIAVSQDGLQLASGDKNGNVQLWRLDRQDPPLQFRGHNNQVWALAFSKDGRYLASGDRSGIVRIWHAHNGRLLREINTGSLPVWSLEFAHDGQSVYSLNDSAVTQWNRDEGTVLNTFAHEDEQLTRMTHDGTGERMATSTASGMIHLWSLADASLLQSLQAADDIVWSSAFSYDGKHIAAASGNEAIRIFDIATGKPIAKLTGHTGGATNVGFLSDQQTLVATDRSGAMHWWDLDTLRRLATPYTAHQRAIWRMAMHPDGQSVATSGDDGLVKIWNALSVRRACEIGTPGFDLARRKQYFGDDAQMLVCAGSQP